MADEPLNKEQIEPSETLPINTMGSESSSMPPEAAEAPGNVDIPVSLNNTNPENTPISTPSPEEVKPEELPAESEKTEKITEPVKVSEIQTAQVPANEPLASGSEPLKPILKISLARELLISARNAIQFRKRKKLDRIMTLFLKQSSITNNEVREFLHVSDATAERYLNTLEKENRIKQVGKTGKAVSYSRIL